METIRTPEAIAGLVDPAAQVQLRLLVVADHSTDVDLLQALLHERLPHAELEPTVEVGLSAALSRLSAEPFDMVLVDGLHHARGAAVTDAIQTAHPETSLVFVSGSTTGRVDLWARMDHAGELKATAISRRTIVETELPGILDQLVLHYQPVVDLTTGRVDGVEALVRWEHPVLGRVLPNEFIPLAERTGLIHAIGDWVLEQAMQDAPFLTRDGRELDIAVNFSVRQLDQRTATKVRETLANAGVRPGRLMVEVTESALAPDEDVVVRTLEALTELGVSVAIDDFGTGYSSLHYLRRYPIDTIKIDREFVAGVGRLPDDEAICRSIVQLASAVGATTIVEGVETAEQYAFLQSIGCRQGQGFLWSAPVPVEQLAAAMTAIARIPPPSIRPQRTRTAVKGTTRRW